MISIIGSGRVGSAIAFLAASTSLDNIHLVNRHRDKALGQELDISNAVPDNSSITVVGTDFSEIKNSEVVVISASVGTYTTSRTEMASKQITMIRDIAKKIKKYAPAAKVLIISNPVDVLTYVFQKEAEMPRENVFGIASSLDSSRFRYLLAKQVKANQSEIKNSLVMGEHGDSMVPIFSIAKWNDKPILEVLNQTQVQDITTDLRDYWKTLRSLKGPSIFGAAKNTVDVLRAIVKNEELSVPVSVLLKGEYDISDVCLGTPVKINREGITNIQEIHLEENEMKLLHKSAQVVKTYLYDEAYQLN